MSGILRVHIDKNIQTGPAIVHELLIEHECFIAYLCVCCADGKTFKKPRRPFEKERLDSELKLVGEFGLRNKRELWRVQMALSKIRQVCGYGAGVLLEKDQHFACQCLLSSSVHATAPAPACIFLSAQLGKSSPYALLLTLQQGPARSARIIREVGVIDRGVHGLRCRLPGRC